jgi:crotonobetainyl-CoA:carnitine CoA-transferase CaiB-like acyl-CoA transferase
LTQGICSDINVIEAGAGSAAASITGMVLADAGARVIKLEPPEGDRLRDLHPSGFRIWNRGKDTLGGACVGCVAVGETGLGGFIAREPALLAGGVTIAYEHPQFGPLVRLSAPALFSASQPRVEPSSIRGQHNVPVLREAGYDEAGIARLESLGALIPPSQ